MGRKEKSLNTSTSTSTSSTAAVAATTSIISKRTYTRDKIEQQTEPNTITNNQYGIRSGNKTQNYMNKSTVRQTNCATIV